MTRGQKPVTGEDNLELLEIMIIRNSINLTNFTFRSSTVEFINHCIVKHNLEQEKVTAAFLVHPCGKKFMSLILDFIGLAIDEVMRKKNFKTGKSIDLDKTTDAVIKMQESEKYFLESFDEEIAKIVKCRESIQNLFSDVIFPQDSLVIVEDFMQNWNEVNKEMYAKMKKSDHSIKTIISSAERLHENAMRMLSFTVNSIEEMLSDPEGQGNEKQASLPEILRKVKMILPVVIDFIRKFNSSIDMSQLSTFEEEQKLVNERLASLNSLANELDELETKVSTSIVPFLELMRQTKAKKTPKDEDDSEISLALKAERERKDQELMSLLRSPEYQLNLNAPKESVMCQRISLMEDVSTKQNNLNETTLYRMPRISFIKRVPSQPGSANNSNFLKPQTRSLFGKINTKDILERATSRVSRTAHNSTRYLGVVPKIITPKMSSTMLSCHQDNELFDCTGVSEIRSMSPFVESPAESETPLKTTNGGILETPVLKSDGISPRRKLIQHFNKEPEKNGKEFLNVQHENTLTDSDRVKEPEDVNKSDDKTISNETAIDSTFAAFRINNDEDLLNVSDTILNELDLSGK